MAALIIIMLWIGMAVALHKYEDKKREELRRIQRKKRHEQAKRYDFDILSCEEPEYFELRKSA